MNKDKELIPELRFPEFKNDGGWKMDTVDSLFWLQDGYPFSSKVFTKSKSGSEQVIRITDINNHNKNPDKVFIPQNQIEDLGIENYKVHKGDLLLSLTGAAGFNFFMWDSKPGFINQRTLKLTPKEVKNESLKVLLEPLIHSMINEIGTGQNNNLSKDSLKDIIFPFPDTEEQQKIASCLTSLDELITAHNKKLEALKDHKKGLLQNLFPQEGETEPKIRFPEFEKDGEWVEKKLGEVGDPKMCKRIFKNQTTPNPEGGIPFYKIGTFGKEADAYIPDDLYNDYKENYNFPDKGDILISASGTIGRLVIYNGEPAYFQDSNIVWLEHDHSEVKNDFLYYCYSNIKWQTSDGGVIKRLYNTDLKNISIKFPKSEDEQIKISNCVATIDAIINEQVEKIDELRHHKKGLMQGLFPNLK
jgi:type I restriction enzyme S subunit